MAAKRAWTMKAKGKTADIYIYEEIDDMFGLGAKQFGEELRALGEVERLNVFINSPGGSVFEGVAIYNQIKRHRARKIVQIDGWAASIASVIAMAGDEIVIAANGLMMIHDPSAMAMGNARELREMADRLDKVGATILDTYVARSGADAARLAELMDAETWLNAAEAVELGLADSVGSEVELAARFDLARFKNAPAWVKEALRAAADGAARDPGADPDPLARRASPAVASMRQTLMRRRLKRRLGPAPTTAG